MKRISLASLFGLLLLAVIPVRAQVALLGDVDLRFYGSRARIDFDELANFGDVATEKLRVRLWASEDHWETWDRGEVIAIGAIPRLQPDRVRHDFHRTLHVHRPDDSGWYYLTLTLEERTFDESGKKSWEIQDIIEFDGRKYFHRSSRFPLPFPF
jgi:hypothetical protein